MPFQLSGNTHTVPIPAVLQMLQTAGVSGILTVRSGSVEKCVHFKNGDIVFATSTDVQDRLGETLIRAGLLTRENLDHALAQFRKNAGLKKIGAILVENRFVTPKDLFSGVKAQVKHILYSLFLWENADYRFEDQIAPDVIQLQLNLQELISEIIERIKSGS